MNFTIISNIYIFLILKFCAQIPILLNLLVWSVAAVALSFRRHLCHVAFGSCIILGSYDIWGHDIWLMWHFWLMWHLGSCDIWVMWHLGSCDILGHVTFWVMWHLGHVTHQSHDQISPNSCIDVCREILSCVVFLFTHAINRIRMNRWNWSEWNPVFSPV